MKPVQATLVVTTNRTSKKKNYVTIQQKWVTAALVALGVVLCVGMLSVTRYLDSVHSHQDHTLSSIGSTRHVRKPESPSHWQSPLSIRYMSDTNDFGGVRARAFDVWPKQLPLPCFEPEQNWPLTEVQRSPAREGFLMVKEMKTGSSTAAGLNLRISRNVARRYFPQFKICRLRNDHATASRLEYGRRTPSKSFLWTIVRDPTKRAVRRS